MRLAERWLSPTLRRLMGAEDVVQDWLATEAAAGQAVQLVGRFPNTPGVVSAVVRMLRAFNRATLRTGNEVSALRRSDRMLGMLELLFHAPQTPLAVREEIIELAGAALRERPNPVGGAGLPPAAGGAVQGAEITGLTPPGGDPAARSRAAPKSVRPKRCSGKSAPPEIGARSLPKRSSQGE